MPLLYERGVFEEVVQNLSSPNVVWGSVCLRGLAQFLLIKSAPNLCPNQNIPKEDKLLVEAT